MKYQVIYLQTGFILCIDMFVVSLDISLRSLNYKISLLFGFIGPAAEFKIILNSKVDKVFLQKAYSVLNDITIWSNVVVYG
jgi:hypothetical protein